MTPLDVQDVQDFGETLRLVRKLAGISQNALGAQIGISGGVLGKYETGDHTPNLRTAIRLMHACGWRLVAVPATDSDGT